MHGNVIVAWVNRLVMMSGDVLVIVIIWTKTSSARKAAKEAAFKRSFAALLLRSGALYVIYLVMLNRGTHLIVRNIALRVCPLSPPFEHILTSIWAAVSFLSSTSLTLHAG